MRVCVGQSVLVRVGGARVYIHQRVQNSSNAPLEILQFRDKLYQSGRNVLFFPSLLCLCASVRTDSEEHSAKLCVMSCTPFLTLSKVTVSVKLKH